MTKSGESCAGSTSFSRVRLGSAFEITALAVISSPFESTTPLAMPSFTRTSMTSAPLRISAPACCAAAAMACVTAPMPPLANQEVPAACSSAAARMSSTRLLPADQGPRNVPKIPRAAMVARRSSVSKYSATRSATAIGPQRSRRYMSRRPSLRRARPVLSIPHRSPELGLSMSGGARVSALPMTRPILASDDWN